MARDIMGRCYKLYNEAVKAELDQNPELALVFYSNFSPYDWEIDPMHNPSWVHSQLSVEEGKLKAAKKRLKSARVWLNTTCTCGVCPTCLGETNEPVLVNTSIAELMTEVQALKAENDKLKAEPRKARRPVSKQSKRRLWQMPETPSEAPSILKAFSRSHDGETYNWCRICDQDWNQDEPEKHLESCPYACAG